MEFSFNFVAKFNINTGISYELKKCLGGGLVGTMKKFTNILFYAGYWTTRKY